MAALLYAHRGAAAERPENTMPSFRRALELGADALELDVHLTADGEVVVAHDPDGARMCGAPRAIRDVPWSEVARWDAGRGFVAQGGGRPFAGQDIHPPRLEELLVEFPSVPLNIDVKQPRPSMVAPLVALLRRHGAEARTTLASFHLPTIVAVRRAGYRGPTALSRAEVVALLATPAAIWRRLPWRGAAAQIPLRGAGLRLDTRAVVERCHARGLRVDYWTVNDAATAERLVALGADGIMTDDPARFGDRLRDGRRWSTPPGERLVK